MERPVPPVQLARTYGIELGTLASLNPAWTRRAVRSGLALPTGTEVWLPEGTLARRESRTAPKVAREKAPAPEAIPVSYEKPAAHAVHVVSAGESLFRIATTYGVRMADLLGLNRLTERSVIHPGQRLRIPVGP